MIGQNDAYGAQGTDGVQEFFSLNDAKRLEHWAEGKSWVSGLGEWALPRDRAGMKESGPTSPNDLGPEHSGEQQHDWQYSQVLGQITQIRGAATVAPSAFGADTSGHFGLHVAATDLAHAAHLALA